MKQTKIKDIYDGKHLSAWQDGECVTIAFPFCAVAIPEEWWKEVKKELKQIIK